VKEGALVAIVDYKSAATALLEGRRFYQSDVFDSELWKRVVSELLNPHGRIDVLVNNAAIVPPATDRVPSSRSTSNARPDIAKSQPRLRQKGHHRDSRATRVRFVITWTFPERYCRFDALAANGRTLT
jgi:NAD(P)-dependent dehydrogenase (short-subunit alcohol dehydrogenase family)